MIRSVVVVGTQWGDEGKGKVVDMLDGACRGGGPVPRRAQCGAHAGYRGAKDRAASDPFGHLARGCALADRQWRRVVSARAARRDATCWSSAARCGRGTFTRERCVRAHTSLAHQPWTWYATKPVVRRRSAPPVAGSARRTRTRRRGGPLRVSDLTDGGRFARKAPRGARLPQLSAPALLRGRAPRRERGV